MRRLAPHWQTMAVLGVLCPLAGVGAGLAFADVRVGIGVVVILLGCVARMERSRALWRGLRQETVHPTLTDLLQDRAKRIGEGPADRVNESSVEVLNASAARPIASSGGRRHSADI